MQAVFYVLSSEYSILQDAYSTAIMIPHTHTPFMSRLYRSSATRLRAFMDARAHRADGVWRFCILLIQSSWQQFLLAQLFAIWTAICRILYSLILV